MSSDGKKKRSTKTLIQINEEGLRNVPVEKYFDSGALPLPKEATELEKKRARENEERLHHIMISERSKLAGLRLTGYEILERWMNYLNLANPAEIGETVSINDVKNIATVLKTMSEVVKNLPSATTIKSIEIKETLEGLGDEELEKRIIEIEASLKQRGVI
jgi:hypothetical protein